MKLPRSLRVLIAMAILALALVVLLLVLTISEATLNIQHHLENAPTWLASTWWIGITLVGLGFGWVLWRILAPARKSREEEQDLPEAPTESELASELEEAQQAGIDVSEAEAELERLRERREGGTIHVALFGEVSTGKSALVNALLPGAAAISDIRGGTTRELLEYTWKSPGGDELRIVDMPGTEEAGGSLDTLAEEEAQRAHIVIYVTDGDLNRRQHQRLTELKSLRKPLILVLNKTDRYNKQDIERLSARLGEYLSDVPDSAVVKVSAAGERSVTLILPNGSERQEVRQIGPRVDELSAAVQRMIDRDQGMLDQLRDSASFILVKHKLDQAVATDRREKAEDLVDGFSKKAVIGALAAITPGADLIIQGWLGTQLVRQLGELYGIPVRKVDIDLLFKLVQEHVGKAHTLLLAVAGNAFKAFPGIGTLAGGAMHAVAYGIIFRTLGRSLIITLETRGELHPRQTAKLFEENLGEDLESPARKLARVVIDHDGADERDGDAARR